MRGLFKESSAGVCKRGVAVTGGRMKEEVAMVGKGDGDRAFGIESTFRSSKVDHVAIFFEHVDFLNCLDRLDVKLL